MIHTFIKTATPHHALDKTGVTMTIETDSLHEAVKAFGDYLRACGHRFGELDMIVATNIPETVTHSVTLAPEPPLLLTPISHETTD